MGDVIKSYLPELQEAVYKRLKSYGVDKETESYADVNTTWIHVRALLSLHLKAETGEGLVKGNKPVTEYQYKKCLEYLDIVLPERRYNE